MDTVRDVQMDDDLDRQKIRNVLAHVLAGGCEFLILMDIGMAITYPAVVIPPLLESHKCFTITTDEATWFASLVLITQTIGNICSIALNNQGRRCCLFYLQLPLLIGWIIPYFATSVWGLYSISITLGIGNGMMQASVTAYIGEASEAKFRGILAGLVYCFLTFGSVVIYGLNALSGNWRYTALYCAILPPLTAFYLYFIPESPIWLISKGRLEEAKKALMWLRGWTDEAHIDDEFKKLVMFNSKNYGAIETLNGTNKLSSILNGADACNDVHISHGYAHNQPHGSNMSNRIIETSEEIPFLKYIFTKEVYKPLLLSLVSFYLSLGIGPQAFQTYVILIFQEFQVAVNSDVAMIVVMAVGMLGNIFCVILMPILGKRKLVFTSIILCMMGIIAFVLYAYLAHTYTTPSWVPIALMIEMFFAANLGVAFNACIIVSEIFPLRGRTIFIGLAVAIGNLMQFLGTKLFYTYVQYLTIGGTFIMYFISYLLGFVFLYYFQVETEGRSLDEIIADFKK